MKVYDVAIIGGGLCGVACAIKLASNGKKVIIIERRPALGWESTYACQHNFNGTSNTIAQTIIKKLNSVGGFRNNITDSPILEIVLDRLVKDMGINLLLYSYPVRMIYEGNTAYGVVIGNKSGEHIIHAKIIVDATEEAILWRQTLQTSLYNLPSARQSVFFNHIEGNLDLPLGLGDGITLYPSLWKDEVRAEFLVESYDPLSARRKIPQIIGQIREEVPQLKEALVSHTGNEPFPEKPIINNGNIEHPNIRNFFGADIWSEDIDNTPIGRLNLGEKAGDIISKCDIKEISISDIMTGSYFDQSAGAVSDVIVVGGGTGGAIAAIAAGREGVKTELIEASPILGGIGTGGAIHSYYYGVDGGIQDEISEKVNEMSPLFLGKWKVNGFHPEVKKIILQQLLESAGVDIKLNTVVSGVLFKDSNKKSETSEVKSIAIMDNKKRVRELSGIIAVGPMGLSIHNAKVFIDSTGDGDIAVMAGAPFQIGRERDNLMHAFSQPCGNLDRNGNLSFMNFDAGYVDPTDVEDLTRGRRHGINLFWQDKFTDETRLLYIAPIIGIRQSRQIIGDYQLTFDDEISGRRFDDVISYTVAHYDNHGWDYENDSDSAVLWVWVLGNWNKKIGCEVPYRCLLPQNVEGLLLACRAISITYDAHMEFRMQKDIQRIGEVAGIAAAISAKKGIYPRKIDIRELQMILKERGLLDEKYRPQPAISADKPLELPTTSELTPENVNEIVWVSTYKGPESTIALKGMLGSSDPAIRFKISTALALHGSNEGLAELIKCVENRVQEKDKANKTVPMWQSAIPFLGMAGDRSAIPVLLNVLEDKESPLDAIISAIRALERIGDNSVIPELYKLLKREDLPFSRVLQVSSGRANPAIENAKWQIDLAIAETLSKLGAPADDIRKIIDPYATDERAYVRRYAEKLLKNLT